MNKEISVCEAAKLRAPTDSATFLDVREPEELAICRLEGALHIPMAEIPARCDSLPRDRPLVVFCHHGIRSAHVVRFLDAKGFANAVNLSGGIHAWSVEVDPQLPRY